MKRYIPIIVGILVAAFALSTLRLPDSKTAFDTEKFGTLPILVNGRIKPLDTVARTSLLFMQHKQTFKRPDGTRLEPVEWLLDVFFRPDLSDDYRHFRIVSPDVLALFSLREEDGDHFRYSFNQLRPAIQELERQAELTFEIESALRTPFQKSVVQLREQMMLYHRLKHSMQLPDSEDFLAEVLRFQEVLPAGVAAARAKSTGTEMNEADFKSILDFANRYEFMASMAYILPVPPPEGSADGTTWFNIGQALQRAFEKQAIDAHVMAYAAMGHAYRAGSHEQFNEIVRIHSEQFEKRFTDKLDRSKVEFRFNHAQPFYKASILFVLAFLLAVFSWLKWPEELGRSAFWVVLVAFLLMTLGIATRMWLEARPPVTNLYSSALFVGWGSVLLGLILERFFRNGIGSVTASTVGFLCLVIAHNLSFTGDTMEMMRAVLDDNFWLATHVVVITIGYSAMFLAGFLAIVYVVMGTITRRLDAPTADALTRMVYGIVCFATLFSLVGTILGGIWADQSWGRFWGWDPKENGALLIVLWCAVILHSRWGGLVRQRGLMNLAILGNVVTAWSWFGVNMLGVGLHSYGFMDSAFIPLVVFGLSQVAIVGLGSLPLPMWRSFKAA
ncbi:MAG TPA: cytochrome c biogenesis protein CcsA [Opitutaceae bacterium]|nr:cytochrome c biogenesis protein CcsA [Opitutaceae bacterium]